MWLDPYVTLFTDTPLASAEMLNEYYGQGIFIFNKILDNRDQFQPDPMLREYGTKQFRQRYLESEEARVVARKIESVISFAELSRFHKYVLWMQYGEDEDRPDGVDADSWIALTELEMQAELKLLFGLDIFDKIERVIAVLMPYVKQFSKEMKKANSKIVHRAKTTGNAYLVQQLTGERIRVVRSSRILPIRKGMDVIISQSRAAANYCRLDKRFTAEIASAMTDVGISVDSIQNERPKYRILGERGVLNPTTVAAALGANPLQQTFVVLEMDDHAVGCLLFRNVLTCFNSYMFAPDIVAKLAGIHGGMLVRLYPNSIPGAGQNDYDIQGSLETEFSTMGECQEFSILIPYEVAKAGALEPLAVLQGYVADEVVKSAFAQMDENVRAVYDALLPMSVSKYNDLRREVKLLG